MSKINRPFLIKFIENISKFNLPYFILICIIVLAESISNFFRKKKKVEYKPSKDETFCITGGSRGMGLDVARYLISKGNKTIILSRSEPPKDILNNILCHHIKFDLKNFSTKKLKGLKFKTLICNAGVLLNSNEIPDLNLEINYEGHKKLIEYFQPEKVLLVSSCVSFAIRRFEKNQKSFFYGKKYAESKFALNKLAFKLKKENENQEIVLVHPGIIKTALFDEKRPISILMKYLILPFQMSQQEGAENILAALENSCKKEINFFFIKDKIKIPEYFK